MSDDSIFFTFSDVRTITNNNNVINSLLKYLSEYDIQISEKLFKILNVNNKQIIVLLHLSHKFCFLEKDTIISGVPKKIRHCIYAFFFEKYKNFVFSLSYKTIVSPLKLENVNNFF